MQKTKRFLAALAAVLMLLSVFTSVAWAAPAKAPTKITLSKTTATVAIKKTLTPTVKVTPAGAVATVKWKSSNDNIAKVSPKGVITGVAAGTATITATSTKNAKIKATIKVTVPKATPTKIALSKTTATVIEGKTVTPTVKATPAKADTAVKWKSGNDRIATVTSKGVIKGVKSGTVTITATSTKNAKLKATIKVTVLKPVPTKLTLSKTTVTLDEGKSATITVKAAPTTADTAVKWSSSDSTVASVTSKGVVKGVKKGVATITAISTRNSKIKATIKVTVNAVAAPIGNAPPSNLDTLTTAAKLTYFNKVVNAVRTQKPGFTRANLMTIDDISLSGMASIASPIVNSIKKNLMPGEWQTNVIAKGSGNDGQWLSENANASDLKTADITSITAAKSGSNWTITVKIINETNPAKKTASANSRINCIATKEEVLSEITNLSDQIKADLSQTTLTYHDGYATIVVNAKGQIVSGESGFQVNAQANNTKISFIKTDVSAPQTTTIKYTDFKY
ncbi:MAG: Ig-like domain-containing protein [Oscillospiraceae bacterium]|jgi:uncharacterized protein YjdB|nr:Ig-like domain-containing protein [Oscillospiraceae bacterium]